MITHIKIDSFGEEGRLERSRLFQVKDRPPEPGEGVRNTSDFYIKVYSISGYTKIVKQKQMCILCGGTGGTRYWYEQDHSETAICPICSGGDQEKWDQAKIKWEGYNG